MLKLHVPKFGSDITVRLSDIAEKQVPTKLKPIVVHVDSVEKFRNHKELLSESLPCQAPLIFAQNTSQQLNNILENKAEQPIGD